MDLCTHILTSEPWRALLAGFSTGVVAGACAFVLGVAFLGVLRQRRPGHVD